MSNTFEVAEIRELSRPARATRVLVAYVEASDCRRANVSVQTLGAERSVSVVVALSKSEYADDTRTLKLPSLRRAIEVIANEVRVRDFQLSRCENAGIRADRDMLATAAEQIATEAN